GEQLPAASSLAWARRNNGLMLHAPDPKTMLKDQDFPISIEVQLLGGLGDELIRHIIDGQTVLEYSRPQIGGGAAAPTDPRVKVDGTPLTGGFIALQAETAPTDFRKVELLNLEGCTDPKARNYK